jgi:hypothetical protein
VHSKPVGQRQRRRYRVPNTCLNSYSTVLNIMAVVGQSKSAGVYTTFEVVCVTGAQAIISIKLFSSPRMASASARAAPVAGVPTPAFFVDIHSITHADTALPRVIQSSCSRPRRGSLASPVALFTRIWQLKSRLLYWPLAIRRRIRKVQRLPPQSG